MTRITVDSHPRIYRALSGINGDSGIRIKDSYPVPENWVPGLGIIESFLASLSNHELDTFAYGDQDEAAKLIKGPAGVLAGIFLNEFFDHDPEGWK